MHPAWAQQLNLDIPSVALAGSGTRLYLVTSAQSVMRTMGSNDAWGPVDLIPGAADPQVNFIEADPVSPLIAWVAPAQIEASGVLRTTDGGETWMAANDGLPAEGQVWGFFTVPNQGGLVYLRVGGEVYKSVDNGASWILQSTLPGPSNTTGKAFSINYNSPNVWYYVNFPSPNTLTVGVYRSDDAGATWHSRSSIRVSNTAAGNQNGVSGIVSDPTDPDMVWVTQAGGWSSLAGVYHSTNGGTSFSRQRASEPIRLWIDLKGDLFTFGSTSAIGSEYFRSTDHGASFNRFTLAPDANTSQYFFFDYANPNVMYATNQVGPYISTNAGTTWRFLVSSVKGSLDLAPVEVHAAPDAGTLAVDVKIQFAENPDWGANYTASVAGGDWVTLKSTSGTIPDTLTLQVTPTGLAVGQYVATLSIDCAPTCLQSPTEVPIRLEVTEPGNVAAPAYLVSTVAGSLTAGDFKEGAMADEIPLIPRGIAFDPQGRLLIADSKFNRILRVNADGRVHTVAGTGVADSGPDGGLAVNTPIRYLGDIRVDPNGGIWFDEGFQLRYINPSGVVSTIDGFQFFDAIDIDGRGTLYISDHGISTLDTATPQANPVELPDGGFSYGSVNGIAAQSDGTVYLTSYSGYIYRRNPDQTVSIVAGTGESGYSGNGLPAFASRLNNPDGIVVDAAGNVIFSDEYSHRIRMINRSGQLVNIAGTGERGFSGEGVLATEAQMAYPGSLAINNAGEIYFADGNGLVRKLTPVRPVIRSELGVTNAASYEESFSPGSFLSIFGEFSGAQTGTAPSFPLPTSLNNVRVTLNGRDMPLTYTSDGQINAIIPYETELGAAALIVYVNGVASLQRNINIESASPGILQFGDHRAVAVNVGGANNGQVNTAATPVEPGGYVVVYLVGMGAPDTPVATGAAVPDTPLRSPVTGPVTVMIGDRTVSYDFLGLTPGFAGLVQLNLPIPGDLADGDYSLKITIGNRSSNTPVITVKR